MVFFFGDVESRRSRRKQRRSPGRGRSAKLRVMGELLLRAGSGMATVPGQERVFFPLAHDAAAWLRCQAHATVRFPNFLVPEQDSGKT
jgi:hypothetical protein